MFGAERRSGRRDPLTELWESVSTATIGTLGALAYRFQHRRQIARDRATLSALPVVGGMSSIPNRAADLPAVLESILPQVERLHLFLHGYDAIPDCARHPAIAAYLMPRSHSYRASGKFYGLSQETAPCLYMMFDDDIIYRDGHVRRLRDALLRYGGRTVVGIFATTIRHGQARYLGGMRVRHFARALRFDRKVDEIGTGTAAMFSGLMHIDPPSWPEGDMDDLMLAIDAERAGIPRIAVARPRGSLVQLHRERRDGLYDLMRADGSRHDVQYARLVKLAQLKR